MSFTSYPNGPRRLPVIDPLVEFVTAHLDRFWASEFGRGLRVSLIAVYAMVLRDASTRFGNRSAGAVWVILTPLIRLGGMILLFHFLDRGPAGGDSLVIFFMTGIIPVFLMRQGMTGATGLIRGSGAMMSYSQIGPLEVVAARVWVDLISDVAVTILIMLGAKAFVDLDIADWVAEPLVLVGGLSMLAYFVYSISFLSAQIGRMFQQWSDIARLLSRVLFFTSGVWYTLGSLPPNLREIILYNPLAHIIEWIRDGSIHGFESGHFDPWYPFWFATVCLFIGLFINLMYRLGGYDARPGA